MELKDVINSIEYHLWSSEEDVGEFLTALIKMHQCKNIIEVGVFRGLTACRLINNLPENGTYTGIDMEDYRNDVVIKFMEEKKAKFVLGDSLIELHKLPLKCFDFIFLDGTHTYKYVKNEFKLSRKLIRPNGIICIHDYQSEGVKNWVDYVSQFKNYQVLILNTSENRGLAVIKIQKKIDVINFVYALIRKKLISIWLIIKKFHKR